MRLVGLLLACLVAGASGGLLAACSFIYKPGCLGEFTPKGFNHPDNVLVYEAAQDVNNWIISHGGEESVAVSEQGLCDIQTDKLEGIVLGKWTGRKILIDVDKITHSYPGNYRNPSFKNVLMHEMLHSLGFEHIPGPGIMNAKMSYDAEFSAGDVAECERVGVCQAPSDGGE